MRGYMLGPGLSSNTLRPGPERGSRRDSFGLAECRGHGIAEALWATGVVDSWLNLLWGGP